MSPQTPKLPQANTTTNSGDLEAPAGFNRNTSLGKTAKRTKEQPGIDPPAAHQVDSLKELELRLKFAEETHAYVREYIRLADQKATFFFAGTTALIAYLHKVSLAALWICPPKSWRIIETLSFSAIVGLTFCTVACLFAILPRLAGSRRGLIHFVAINDFTSSSEYANAIASAPLKELLEQKIRHAHELSGICSRKYTALRFAQWAGAIGTISTVLLLILST